MNDLLSHALFDGPCAVSMKAIKNLNLCHGQNRPCIHFFFFFFYPSYWKNYEVSCFGPFSLGFCAQKDDLHARVCTDSISCVYADFNCCGLCAPNIIWCFLLYLHEAAEMWHWLWGCAGVFIKRQPCSRALETDPICSRPGWVVKNSSKCGPQGFTHPHTPPGPFVPPFATSLSYCWGWGAGGGGGEEANAQPPQRRKNEWWGVVGP